MMAMDVALPWTAISMAPILFVLGYLFIGSLMLATGSLGADIAESQKLTMGWAILALLPLMSILFLIEHPHGPIAKVLSVVPFSVPLALIVRLSVDPEGTQMTEVLVGVSSLVAATWLTVRVGARLFRVGLLLKGERPPLRELLRQSRLLE